MYKLPIKSPIKPIVTQLYGNTSLNSWYQSNGIKNAFHNGADISCGTNVQSYGTPIVCPFPEGGYVDEIVFDSPMSTKGNGVYIKSNLVANTQFKLILWHTGEIVVKKGQQLKEGDIICYMGNSGLVSPPPTTANPYAGTHLHFGCYKIFKGQYVYEQNHTILGECDPLLHFDKNQWYPGTDSGFTHDLAPANWMWTKLGITNGWDKFISILKFWK